MYLLTVFLLTRVFVTNTHGFGYGRNAQLQWSKEYDHCGGKLQSPIIINSSGAVEMGMPALETIRYHNLLPDDMKLQNNGHSVALSFAHMEDCHEFNREIPYIFGALLDSEYQFEGLHFHWGGRNNRGSEHIFNDIRYPMEMHLIHRNRKYKDMKKALKHRDGLTVLGIFFQLSEKPNESLENLLKYFPSIKKFNQSVRLSSSFMLSSLIPNDRDRFYTYKGSLTTPPCSEVVTWIVFPETIPISLRQMNKFRRISDESGREGLMDNYRHVQALGSRKLYVRNGTMKLSNYFSGANFLKWNWFVSKDITNNEI